MNSPERGHVHHTMAVNSGKTVMTALYHNLSLSCFYRVHGSQACQMHAAQLWISRSSSLHSSRTSSSMEEVGPFHWWQVMADLSIRFLFFARLWCAWRNLPEVLNVLHGLRRISVCSMLSGMTTSIKSTVCSIFVWGRIDQAARHSTPVSGGTGVYSTSTQRG